MISLACFHLNNIPYRQRLQRLGLSTLLERRMRGDFKIETFKIINGSQYVGSCHYATEQNSTSINGFRLVLTSLSYLNLIRLMDSGYCQKKPISIIELK